MLSIIKAIIYDNMFHKYLRMFNVGIVHSCFAFFLATGVTSCDVDLLDRDKRQVAPGIELQRFMDGGAIFQINVDVPNGNNLLKARIVDLGWNEKIVVANVVKQFSDEKSGLYTIDIATKRVDGPIDRVESLENIKLIPVAKAFVLLGK